MDNKKSLNFSKLEEVQLINIMVGNSNNIVILYDPESRKVDFVSESIERALGISVQEVKNDLDLIFAMSKDEEEINKVKKWYRNGRRDVCRANASFENRKLKTQRLYQIEITSLNIDDESRVIAVFMDRTKESNRNRKMQDVLSLTTNEATSRRDQIAEMSHNFRTTMTVITGYLMLISKSAEDPERVREYTHRISDSCAELMTVVNRMVELNENETSELSLNIEEFSLRELVSKLQEEYFAKAQAVDIRFDCEMSGIIHNNFLGDVEKISEILGNVLSNAVKYTSAGGNIRLEVCEKQTEEGPELVFTIEDNGIGIEKERLGRVFDPLAKERRYDSVHGKSMGYGLVIGKKLTNIMGGALNIESEVNRGSKVTLRIPLITADQEQNEFWAEHGIKRVLVATANVAEAARIQSLLRALKVDTVCTTSGYGAIQMIEHAYHEKQGFDIFLIDDEVHEMESLGIARSLQAMAWIDVPMVVLMTNDMISMAQEEDLGISGVISKPFNLDNLYRLIDDMGVHQLMDSSEDGMDLLQNNFLSQMRCLIVEDDVLNADIIRGIMEIEGAKCEIAGNGKAAVAMYSNSKEGYYDLILMDLQMPVMNGFDAADAIRNNGRPDAKTIPIIAMTAITFAKDIKESFDSGMDAYIAKPIDARMINSTIREILLKKR